MLPNVEQVMTFILKQRENEKASIQSQLAVLLSNLFIDNDGLHSFITPINKDEDERWVFSAPFFNVNGTVWKTRSIAGFQI